MCFFKIAAVIEMYNHIYEVPIIPIDYRILIMICSWLKNKDKKYRNI